jgi:ABC-type multidrug transport system fused ATPase/permease subunit
MHDDSPDHISSEPPVTPWAIRWWWLWAILALIAGAITTAAAQGFPIVDLELAGTVERADAVVRGVSTDAIRSAILWDFVFIVLYVLALVTGALWSATQFTKRVGRRIGVIAAAGAVAAGLFDVVENLSMLAYLNGSTGWISLARVMAIPKFLLIVFTIVYIIAGATVLSVRRIRRDDTAA